MTEKRKQELWRLLNEAMGNLEIRLDLTNRHQLPPIININEYRSILQQYWIFHSTNSLSLVMYYKPHIVNAATKSKLLDFIREEFASFIHEDKIQSASFFIKGGTPFGYPLDDVLKQLLKIAIVFGVERSISDFDRCTENTSGSFQYIALLEGIRIEKEIQVFEGLRLVPLPHSTSELPHYLPNLLTGDMPIDFLGKTLLVISASVSPIFYKPFPNISLPEGFQVEVTGGKFPNFHADNFYEADDFYEKFCQALSLVCNSAVRTSLQWRFLEEHELFNLNPVVGVSQKSWSIDAARFRDFTAAGETQIEEAKCLYQNLVKLDSKFREKLQIPIDRWIKSKTSQGAVDKIIDLGIAFESLYLSGTESKNEIRFRFSLHATWHLGEDKEQRKALMKEFKAIYDWRSTVVHTGKLPNKRKKTSFTPEEVEAFITNAQNLCRDSIMKILEKGKFPDWNDLILG